MADLRVVGSVDSMGGEWADKKADQMDGEWVDSWVD